jgi:hypothetical protein
MYKSVNHTVSRLARKTETCNTLSSLLYRPDDDPVKGRNIVAKYQIYLYLVKSCVRRSIIIIIIIIIISIQPLGRFGRNQSPVRRPVWLWYAAF